MNMVEQVFLWYYETFIGYMLKSNIAGSWGWFVSILLRKDHNGSLLASQVSSSKSSETGNLFQILSSLIGHMFNSS